MLGRDTENLLTECPTEGGTSHLVPIYLQEIATRAAPTTGLELQAINLCSSGKGYWEKDHLLKSSSHLRCEISSCSDLSNRQSHRMAFTFTKLQKHTVGANQVTFFSSNFSFSCESRRGKLPPVLTFCLSHQPTRYSSHN